MPLERPRATRAAPLAIALFSVCLGGSSAGGLASAGGDPSLDALRRRLEDEEPAARAAAVRRLATAIGGASGLGADGEPALRLVVHALGDPHPYVRRSAGGVLGGILDTPLRTRLLKDIPGWKDSLARAEAAETFAAWADRDGRTGLLRLLADKDASVRAAAAEALADDSDEAATHALVLATSDPDGRVRATALESLLGGPFGARPASGVRGLRGPGGGVRAPGGADRRANPGGGGGAGGGGGGRRPRDGGDVPLRALSRDRDERVRLCALEGSVAAGGETAVFAVEHGLDDAVWSVRLVAAELAGTVRDRRVLAPLVGALRDPRDRVAGAAGAALVRLTGIPFDADPVRWTSWLQAEGASFDPATVEPKPASGFDAGGKTVASVRFLDLPLVSSHVTFVLDASGSMATTDAAGVSRWDRVRAELDRVLGTLGTSAEGNVVLFSDEATTLFPSAVRFSPAVRERVAKALAGRPPAGKTALYDGIAKALEDPVVDAIVVLSDGAPSAGSWFTKTDVRTELAKANRWRRARIDVMSIGTDEVAKRWRSLLRDLAQDHGGRCVGPS